MARYYVNDRPQTTGEHEVHKSNCIYLPANKTDLGEHDTCHSAVRKAKQIYSNSDGCATCCPECHTR
jgi:hypothetical protein